MVDQESNSILSISWFKKNKQEKFLILFLIAIFIAEKWLILLTLLKKDLSKKLSL